MSPRSPRGSPVAAATDPQSPYVSSPATGRRFRPASWSSCLDRAPDQLGRAGGSATAHPPVLFPVTSPGPGGRAAFELAAFLPRLNTCRSKRGGELGSRWVGLSQAD